MQPRIGGEEKGTGGAKIGNAHLKWAFSEAAVLFIRHNPPAKKLVEKLGEEARQGQGADDPGAQAGAGDLLHAEEQRAVPAGEIPEGGVNWRGREQPKA